MHIDTNSDRSSKQFGRHFPNTDKLLQTCFLCVLCLQIAISALCLLPTFYSASNVMFGACLASTFFTGLLVGLSLHKAKASPSNSLSARRDSLHSDPNYPSVNVQDISFSPPQFCKACSVFHRQSQFRSYRIGRCITSNILVLYTWFVFAYALFTLSGFVFSVIPLSIYFEDPGYFQQVYLDKQTTIFHSKVYVLMILISNATFCAAVIVAEMIQLGYLMFSIYQNQPQNPIVLVSVNDVSNNNRSSSSTNNNNDLVVLDVNGLSVGNCISRPQVDCQHNQLKHATLTLPQPQKTIGVPKIFKKLSINCPQD